MAGKQTTNGGNRSAGNQGDMESFAAKVRYGNAPRFDPMMEERGGWIAGEAPRQDIEMEDAVVEGMAEARHQISKGDLNPFKGYNGEILPLNMERSFSGFLVRKEAIKFKVNTEKLLVRIDVLKDQLLIGKFIGPKPSPHAMNLWIQALNHELRGSALLLCRNVGKGYFFLRGEDKDTLNNALMVSPFRSKWGTCMLQSWIPGFNPDNPSNLAFPTWVSLRNLPQEHQDQAIGIVETLGEVIGMETANESAKDPRFCINLEISKGWATSIELITEGEILPPQTVLIDYEKLPIRCRVCLSWKHKASECKENQKRPYRGRGRVAQPHHIQHQERGKNVVVDQEGFQQVRNRKNTRRNIFECNQYVDHDNVWKGTTSNSLNANVAAATAAAHDKSGLDEQQKDLTHINQNTNLREKVAEVAVNDAKEMVPRSDENIVREIQQTRITEPNNNLNNGDLRRAEQESTELSIEKATGGRDIGGPAPDTEGEPPTQSERNPALSGAQQDLNTGKIGYTTIQHQSDSQTGGEAGGDSQINKEGGEERTQKSLNSTRTSGEFREEGGQSAFETSMHWSPTKQTGHKRNLEAVDEDAESESEVEREEGELNLERQGEYSKQDTRHHQEEESERDGEERALAIETGDCRYPTVVEGAEPGSRSLAPAEQGHGRKESTGGPTGRLVKDGNVAESETRGGQSPGGGREHSVKLGRNNSPLDKGSHPEKHGRGGKVQRICKYIEEQADTEMDTEEGRIVGTVLPPVAGPSFTEVIPKTQPILLNNKGSVYKDILASIGLDSPTSSNERGSNLQRANVDMQQGYTPIRNSAESLMALGKHMFTPRQGRRWNERSKSPLGN